jgi:hypothetical protein
MHTSRLFSAKLNTRKAFALALICAGVFTPALAEVSDRTIQVQSNPEALFEQIVQTATSMCEEAARAGEIVDVAQCVDIVVMRTVDEMNQADLTTIAQNQRPTLIASR